MITNQVKIKEYIDPVTEQAKQISSSHNCSDILRVKPTERETWQNGGSLPIETRD